MVEEKETSRIWLDDNGIINVKMAKEVSERELLDLFKKGRTIAENLKDKALILIDLTSGLVIFSSKVRKLISENVMKLGKDLGFKKIAIYGGIMPRTVASFIISATGVMKNIRLFDTREEALKWLKAT